MSSTRSSGARCRRHRSGRRRGRWRAVALRGRNVDEQRLGRQQPAVGAYTVEFIPLGRWITPASVPVVLGNSQMVGVTGLYTQVTGVSADIAPTAAIAAGAQWRVGSGNWTNAGVVVGVAAGTYTVELQAARRLAGAGRCECGRRVPACGQGGGNLLHDRNGGGRRRVRSRAIPVAVRVGGRCAAPPVRGRLGEQLRPDVRSGQPDVDEVGNRRRPKRARGDVLEAGRRWRWTRAATSTWPTRATAGSRSGPPPTTRGGFLGAGVGSAVGQFQGPADVAVDSSLALYVADNLNNRIQKNGYETNNGA